MRLNTIQNSNNFVESTNLADALKNDQRLVQEHFLPGQKQIEVVYFEKHCFPEHFDFVLSSGKQFFKSSSSHFEHQQKSISYQQTHEQPVTVTKAKQTRKNEIHLFLRDTF